MLRVAELLLVLQLRQVGGDRHHHPEDRRHEGQHAQRHEDQGQPDALQASACGAALRWPPSCRRAAERDRRRRFVAGGDVGGIVAHARTRRGGPGCGKRGRGVGEHAAAVGPHQARKSSIGPDAAPASDPAEAAARLAHDAVDSLPEGELAASCAGRGRAARCA